MFKLKVDTEDRLPRNTHRQLWCHNSMHANLNIVICFFQNQYTSFFIILICNYLSFYIFWYSGCSKLNMETTIVDIEPSNDQTIAHNQDSKPGGDTIDHSMEVIILEINSM